MKPGSKSVGYLARCLGKCPGVRTVKSASKPCNLPCLSCSRRWANVMWCVVGMVLVQWVWCVKFWRGVFEGSWLPDYRFSSCFFYQVVSWSLFPSAIWFCQGTSTDAELFSAFWNIALNSKRSRSLRGFWQRWCLCTLEVVISYILFCYMMLRDATWCFGFNASKLFSVLAFTSSTAQGGGRSSKIGNL